MVTILPMSMSEAPVGTKIGLGTVGPSQAIPLLDAQIAAGIAPAGIIGVDDAGIALDARKRGAQLPTITRFVNRLEDGAQFLSDPALRTQANYRAHARAVLGYCLDGTYHSLNPEERAAMNWLGVLNEPDTPGVDGWRALGEYCCAIMQEASASYPGLKLALVGFCFGTPEAAEWDAFASTGCLEMAEARGDIWLFHEGARPGTDDPIVYGTIPGAWYTPDAGPQFLRYRFWLERCRQTGRHMRLAVTEIYFAGRYQVSELDLTLAQALQYDRELQKDPEVIFAAPFTLVGPTGQKWAGQDYYYLYQALIPHQAAMAHDALNPHKTYTVLDRSKYQEKPINSGADLYEVKLDMGALQQTGVAALIHRLGIGDYYLDPTFEEALRRNLSTSVPWGVYHVFRAGRNPIAQARFVFDHLRKLTPLNPPAGLYTDWEEGSGELGTATYSDQNIYLAELDRLFEILTGVYTRASYLNPRFTPAQQLAWRHRPLWDAHYVTPPISRQQPLIPSGWVGKEPPYVLWQYMVSGVPGIFGPVDVNVTYPDAPLSAFISTAAAAEKEIAVALELLNLMTSTLSPEQAAKVQAHIQALVNDVNARGDCYAYGAGSPARVWKVGDVCYERWLPLVTFAAPGGAVAKIMATATWPINVFEVSPDGLWLRVNQPGAAVLWVKVGDVQENKPA